MDTQDADEREVIRKAMSLIGRARTDKKIAAARATAEARRRVKWTEEQKAKLSEAQKARRDRERAEREALGLATPEASEKRKPGRPRTRPEADPDAPKKPVGRPKKQASE